LKNELLLLKKFIMRERFSFIINFFNSNNSFIKKCQVFFNRLVSLLIFKMFVIVGENGSNLFAFAEYYVLLANF